MSLRRMSLSEHERKTDNRKRSLTTTLAPSSSSSVAAQNHTGERRAHPDGSCPIVRHAMRQANSNPSGTTAANRSLAIKRGIKASATAMVHLSG
eukprot:CAMPEP_0172926468 /NCGR_PEP_ID=MMETSP1075-20121228/215617_1 /TAXON_ID=2916 /ORGANISM="Ceratium fusus, Strain PA161109" /LENGTH=93 /DNA_ID=CAMNT_0013787535 /DNA_START=403 /DNA_END=684 /DNA_ORIENTATION=+